MAMVLPSLPVHMSAIGIGSARMGSRRGNYHYKQKEFKLVHLKVTPSLYISSFSICLAIFEGLV